MIVDDCGEASKLGTVSGGAEVGGGKWKAGLVTGALEVGGLRQYRFGSAVDRENMGATVKKAVDLGTATYSSRSETVLQLGSAGAEPV